MSKLIYIERREYPQLGPWNNEGRCEAARILPSGKPCGGGQQKQTRNCTDGEILKCSHVNTQRLVSCNGHWSLSSCFNRDCSKKFGRTWFNNGTCVGVGSNSSCGPGIQRQVISCEDGINDNCTYYDQNRMISCSLPDCQKKFGVWKLEGKCEGMGKNSSCGPGRQARMRTCVDGTRDRCTKDDERQLLPCLDVNTQLPPCAKILGNWINQGDCQSVKTNSSCGLGNQLQSRGCINGTIDKCNADDLIRSIPCKQANSKLPNCTGSCILVK